MRVIIASDYEELSKRAAELVKNRLRAKPGLVLGLATGSTPLGLYREMCRMYREEKLSFAQVKTFNLDEYLFLAPDHPQSYHHFMFQNLFNHLDVPRENIHIPDGMARDPEDFCRWYEEEIEKAGGLDLQVLGMGSDGHIGFNEPGSSLTSRTRIKTLDQQTIEDNSRFFNNKKEVPRFAITMGVGTIMEAEEIILLAGGAKKAPIVARAIEGPITSQVTASVLQVHPRVVVILDEAAAASLERKEYYKYVEEQRAQLEK